MLRLSLAALALLTIGSSCIAKPLPLRVWELQDYNMGHIKRLIDLAAQQKVTRIHLSHKIIMYAQSPAEDPQLARDINTICGWAHEKGIKVDVWCRELSGIPEEFIKDRKIDLNNPQTWEAIQAKYTKLLDLCPGIDGVVITMSEGSVGIWYDTKVTSSLPAPDRIAKLIDTIDTVCQEHGKDLFCRTFAYTPGDIKVIQDGIKLCKADVIAMPKCVPHDWQPFFPFSPEIGDFNGKRFVVEFDLGHEFTGQSKIPYINIDYMKRHLDYDISRGTSGAVFRVERNDCYALDTLNQAVIDVSTRLLIDPLADPHKLYQWWLQDRYPAEAVPHIYSALMRTQDIVEKGLFTLGNWVSDHSRLPNYRYAKSHLTECPTSYWDPSDKWIQLTQQLQNPTAATIRRVTEEKDDALSLANASLADLEQAKPYLTPEDYTYLTNHLQREKAMVEVWKAAMEVFLGIDAYKTSKSTSDARALSAAADRLEKTVTQNRTNLIALLSGYTDTKPTANIDTALDLIRQARQTLQE